MELFNTKKYLSNYPDLQANGITLKTAYKHFINCGLNENRTFQELSLHNFCPKQKKTILFTNARDEPHLKEWCKFHLLLGFDCIYIFDHLSEPSISHQLFDFDPRICIFRINLSSSKVKLKCINYAIEFSKAINPDWMLYLDADEFLVLNEHTSVQDFLNSFPPTADLIGVNWLMFGTNNLIKQPESIISHFTKSDLKLNQHIKSFVRPNKIINFPNPHTYFVNGTAYNVKKEIIGITPFVHLNTEYYNVSAYIAHYIYQSEEMYIFRKISKPDDLGGIRTFDPNIHTYYNEVENLSVKEKYSGRLKDE